MCNFISPRWTRDFLFLERRRSERNNISRVHRGEVKALYFRLINFIFLRRIINPFEPLRNCETQTKVLIIPTINEYDSVQRNKTVKHRKT